MSLLDLHLCGLSVSVGDRVFVNDSLVRAFFEEMLFAILDA